MPLPPLQRALSLLAILVVLSSGLSGRVRAATGAYIKAPLVALQSVIFLGPKSAFCPPESLAMFSCDEKSQAIAINFAIFSRKNASPLRFGWPRRRLRQKIVAICDCDFWCFQHF